MEQSVEPLTGCKIVLLCEKRKERERRRKPQVEIQLDHVLLLGPPTMGFGKYAVAAINVFNE